MKAVIAALGLVGIWQLICWATGAPAFLLPSPMRTALALYQYRDTLLYHALITCAEIIGGLCVGTLFGILCAIALTLMPRLRPWLLPLLIASQAIPVFALAPLLVLWIGFGATSKIVMAGLIIFFPVTTAFYDGLRRTEPGWLDLARVMNATPLHVLLRIRVPAALPALASGLRMATAIAPIGAVIGEWVGASAGLGYLMLHANGRSQTDMMFAALLVLAVLSVLLWFAVDAALRRLIPWQPDRLS